MKIKTWVAVAVLISSAVVRAAAPFTFSVNWSGKSGYDGSGPYTVTGTVTITPPASLPGNYTIRPALSAQDSSGHGYPVWLSIGGLNCVNNANTSSNWDGSVNSVSYSVSLISVQPYGGGFGTPILGTFKEGGSIAPKPVDPNAKKTSGLKLFTNPYAVPVIYTVWDKGNIVEQFTVNPGETLYRAFSLPAAATEDLTITESITQARLVTAQDGTTQVLEFDPTGGGQSALYPGVTVPFGTLSNGSFTTGAAPSSADSSTATPAGTQTPVADDSAHTGASVTPVVTSTTSAPVIWSSSQQGSSTTNLDQATYQQGVNGTTTAISNLSTDLQKADGQNAQQAHNDAVQAHADASALDGDVKAGFAANHTDLQQLNTDLTPMANAYDPAKNQFNVSNALSSAQSQANGAAGYTGAKLANGSAVSVAETATDPGTLGQWSLTGNSQNIVTISLNPASSMWASADGLLRACRGLISLAVVIWFVWSVGRALDVYLTALPQVQAAESGVGVENLVPGVVQGKTWTAAGIIVGILMATAAVIVAVLDTWLSSRGYGIGTLFAAVDLSPIGGAVALLDRYIPLTTVASLSILRAGLTFIIGPIYLVAASTLKFIKA